MAENNDEAPPPPKPILLGGEDAMEEDEAQPVVPQEVVSPGSVELISRIVTPSPYPHHMTGPASSRFRNALSRVTTHPTSDIEAWQALITEASGCYRNILPSLHSADADTHAKLDWMESCYGTLLKHFPYASAYYVTVVEMLLAQSARVGEEDGPVMDYGMDPSQRQVTCEAKVEAIFRRVLGIEMDGTPVENDAVGGMCTSSVELWLLYIKKRVRDANRHANTLPSQEARVELVREWTTKAYEVAIDNASFVYNNDSIWKQYLSFVKSWMPTPTTDHALAQKQMVKLRSVYQRLVTHPMTGLDQLWQEYEAFERGQSEQLAAALIAEFAPKYNHARSVYLERGRVYSVLELQMNRLATPPVDDEDEDYHAKMAEEHSLLTLWTKRVSYERTNPERLSPNDLVQRVRQAYKEMACALTRHPEVWHMWSMWELHRTGAQDSEKAANAVAVLQLAQHHIPDSTLLAHEEAQIVEVHTEKPSDCMAVMERYLDRNPTTLGFVLYQRMVRRYKGAQAARAVFARARRVLLDTSAVEAKKEETKEIQEGAAPEAGESETSGTTNNPGNRPTDDGKRRMVTNRLDATVGTSDAADSAGSCQPKAETANPSDPQETGEPSSSQVTPGPISWHLYASHASMEHLLNRSPDVAARVYELGLRKHVSFLTKPAYVLRYAQLLLELQDTENLRALLTRAVAACEAKEGQGDAVAALWDMTLRFESILSGTAAGNASAVQTIERRRRAALMGPEVEDVSTGGLIGSGDAGVGIGAHKSTLSEQLVRSEGYDTSSIIVNGMSRAVDVLEIMGLWGKNDGEQATKRFQLANDKTDSQDDGAGGKSDACYQRRLRFQRLSEAGLATELAMGDGSMPGVAAGSKILTARERLQQAGGASVTQTGQTGAAALAIQQSPEWLRPLLLLLPVSRYRSAAMNKPPPHMIEMALSSLRASTLPAERPSDDAKVNGSRKRKFDSGGDSSDEENGGLKGGGYGSQFRARQRARQMAGEGQQNGTLNDQ